MTTATRKTNHRRATPCPICAGYEEAKRGTGERCHGWTSGDGYAHCSREEHAGGLHQEDGGTFAHRLGGPCRCGVTHGEAAAAPGPEQRCPRVIRTTRYPILEADRSLAAEHVRRDLDDGSKTFSWSSPSDPHGLGGRRAASLPLYRLPDLLDADPGADVIVVEGEKTADALHSAEFIAVGTITGASNTPSDDTLRPLVGRRVFLWADHDDLGRAHMDRIAASLVRRGCMPRLVTWPGAQREGDDAADFFAWGGTADELRELLAVAPEWSPGDAGGSSRNGHDESRKPGSTTPPRHGNTITNVLDRWAEEKALIHEPTGIGQLDELTGGGPVYGSRWYVAGAPEAGKTALLLQIADAYASRGVVVGLLAVDEDSSDIVTRFAQRRGFSRSDCERRLPSDLAAMRERMVHLPVYVYGATSTIEAAAEDLAKHAKEVDARAMLGVDSIQTARSALEGSDGGSLHQLVTARVQALRYVAETHRLIAIATSEMSRAAYRSLDATDRIDDMAAAKESGAIEYSARVLIVLRSVEGESDLVEMRLAKNKHGMRHRPGETGIHLQMDRARQTLTEATDYVAPTVDSGSDARAAVRDQQAFEDAARIAGTVARHPGRPAKNVQEMVTAATPGGMGRNRYGRARGILGPALVEWPGVRTQVLLYLDGAQLPSRVLDAVPIAERPFVAAARPPQTGEQKGVS